MTVAAKTPQQLAFKARMDAMEQAYVALGDPNMRTRSVGEGDPPAIFARELQTEDAETKAYVERARAMRYAQRRKRGSV